MLLQYLMKWLLVYFFWIFESCGRQWLWFFGVAILRGERVCNVDCIACIYKTGAMAKLAEMRF